MRKFQGKLVLTAGIAACLSGCMSVMPMMAPTVTAEKNISSEFPFESRFVTVNGSKMHYVETGSGTPIVFLHGNPTSNYLWRNILPIVAKNNRVIALDLIGMGKSDKPDLAYNLDDQIRYFDGFMAAMYLKEAILVVHDWGGPIGIDYAMRHQDQVKSIVMMETLVRPMRWDDFDFGTKYMFGKLRDPIDGNNLIVKENYFVEKLLTMFAGRKLDDKEMSAYRAPFLKESDRKVVANWPREIPLDGIPKKNDERFVHNFELLQKSKLPLLLLTGQPGAIMKEEMVASLKVALPRMSVREIGPGLHFLQESQPTNIGNAIAHWVEQSP